MQTAQEQRKALRRRVVGYVTMVISIIIIATALFFLMLGYRFNAQNGTIQQGGLVQFISQPNGAHITVGVAELARPTKTKITLNPGVYTVKMELDGYQTWQKSITVQSGKVLWLNSTRFVPNERQTSTVANMARVDDTLVRQSGKQLAILPNNTVPKLTLAPLTSRDTVELETISFSGSKLQNKKGQRFHLLEWSSNDRYILLMRTYKTKHEVVLIDTRNPERAVVVSSIGKVYPVQATFDPRSTQNIVVRYSDGTVRLVDGGSGKVSSVVLKDVAHMQMSQKSIVYTAKPINGVTRTGYYLLDNGEDFALGTYRTKSNVIVSLRKYYSDYFIVTTIGKKMIIQTTPELPSNGSEILKLRTLLDQELPAAPLAIGFQNSNRLVYAAGPRSVTSYDLEVGSLITTPLLGRTKHATPAAVEWLDGQHFWDDATGYLRQYEYDGTNQADIVGVAKGMSAAYTTDGKYLYSFAGTKKSGYTLQRTKMIVN